MKRLLLFWMVVGAVGPLQAQPVGPGSDTDIAVQQRRLDIQRHEAAQQAHEDQLSCQERFAVNDCLKAAQARDLERIADIRRQQERLNDLQRRQSGDGKIRAHEEKKSQHEQQLRDAAVRSDLRARAAHDNKNGDQRPSVRGTGSGNLSSGAPEKAKMRAQPSTPDARQEYQRKLQDAESRRQARDKRIQEKASGKPPAPLPAAP